LSKTHLIIPDCHAHPDYNNDRADWIGQLIKDVQPDVVINLGDAADMTSLSAYDKGKRSFAGRSYAKDIESHLDFQDRMWDPVYKTKKKLPYSVVLEGNHEHRIERALDLSPELVGTIGFDDFQFDSYYNEVVRYEGGTPGIVRIDGISYAHYFVTGVMGRALSGEHPAYALITKQLTSATQGHSHVTDYSVRTRQDGEGVPTRMAGVQKRRSNDQPQICTTCPRG
jgi:hypothetical protein